MKVLKYNFFEANRLVNRLFGKQVDSPTGGMDTASYYSESPLHNMGPIFFFMTLLPVLHLILTIFKFLNKKSTI